MRRLILPGRMPGRWPPRVVFGPEIGEGNRRKAVYQHPFIGGLIGTDRAPSQYQIMGDIPVRPWLQGQLQEERSGAEAIHHG